MNQDIRDYMAFLSGQALRILFATMGMALLARILGPDGLGRWAMITAAATLMHLGLINWIQQDPLLRFGKEEWVKTGQFSHAWSVRLPFIGVGIAVAVLLFVTAPFGWIHEIFLLSGIDRILSFCFLFSLLVSTELQTMFQISGRMVALALAPAVVAVCTFFLYALLWFGHVQHHRFGICLGGTIALTAAVWMGAGALRLRGISLKLEMADNSLAKTMLHFAWPILPTTIVGYCMSWGNQILIRHFFTTHDVGLYQAAFQVHSLVVSLAVPLTTIIAPKLIGRHFEDPTVSHRYVGTIAPTLFCLWLIVTIPGVVILPIAFQIIFGKQYLASLPILTAFLMCTPLCALGQLYTGLYTVQKKMEQVFIILLLMLGVNALAIGLTLPNHHIRDIALAFSYAFVFSQFLTYFYQHRFLNESSLKMNALMLSALLFSVGQVFLVSMGLRFAWGAGMLVVLVAAARRTSAVDSKVLERLFAGRLSPFKHGLERIFVGSRVLLHMA